MGAPVTIVWFKRDLRIADHPPLCMAAERGCVIPLYVAEPALWAQPAMSARHWDFISETLVDLRGALARAGATLVLRIGDAVDVLAALVARTGADAVYAHEETGDLWTYARDRRVAQWARGAGVTLRTWPAGGVVRRLRSRNGWAATWDRRMAAAILPAPGALAPALTAPEPGEIPAAAALGLRPDPCPDRQPGGRRTALATLDSFLTARGRTYRKAMASPVTGFEACSRLSPHLAWGALSPREAAQAAHARRAGIGGDRVWAGSVDSFLSRLHWRCHFMQKLEDAPDIERRCMHRAYEGLREGDFDPAKLAAWEAGETGFPFVDACLRSLRATGWMNFRMRAMLTAFAAYHLWIDWRRFGPPLAQMFTDYEPGIHWSQVQMQSGVTGINTTRVYNPVKQSLDQDPEGAFIRRWVPELEGVPLPRLHTPWKMAADEQRAAACVLDRDYPAPIVDHEAAAREAKARVHAVRRGAAFAEEKAAVMRKHASRKPGRDGFPRRKTVDPRQTAFDF